jgi:hypothetical protein
MLFINLNRVSCSAIVAHCRVLNLARCSIARARAGQCLSGPLSFGSDAVNVNGKELGGTAAAL